MRLGAVDDPETFRIGGKGVHVGIGGWELDDQDGDLETVIAADEKLRKLKGGHKMTHFGRWYPTLEIEWLDRGVLGFLNLG